MTYDSDHTEWHELVAGYALHALDSSDVARVEEHLAGCEQCRSELDSHALTASHLASLADDAATPPPAWSSIRAAVVGEASPAVADLAAHRERRRPARWLLSAAAAAVLVVAGTLVGWQIQHSQRGSDHAPVVIAQCAGLAGCQQIDLRSSDGVRRATVIVDDGQARVQPVALRPLASGRTFVLWQLPRGGAPIALGEFASTTTTSTADVLAAPMAQTTGFAVSSEPAGPPPAAPTRVVALGGATV